MMRKISTNLPPSNHGYSWFASVPRWFSGSSIEQFTRWVGTTCNSWSQWLKRLFCGDPGNEYYDYDEYDLGDIPVEEFLTCSLIWPIGKRLFLILMLFFTHNLVCFICYVIGFNCNCEHTFLFNVFLGYMMLKLFIFGLLNTAVRMIFGLKLNRSNILGCILVWPALFMLFYHYSSSWIQLGYNVVILGSLFTNRRNLLY